MPRCSPFTTPMSTESSQQGGAGPAPALRPQEVAEPGWHGTDAMWPWRDRTINSWFGTLRNGYRLAALD